MFKSLNGKPAVRVVPQGIPNLQILRVFNPNVDNVSKIFKEQSKGIESTKPIGKMGEEAQKQIHDFLNSFAHVYGKLRTEEGG